LKHLIIYKRFDKPNLNIVERNQVGQEHLRWVGTRAWEKAKGAQLCCVWKLFKTKL
jgi:hypothetical protein